MLYVVRCSHRCVVRCSQRLRSVIGGSVVTSALYACNVCRVHILYAIYRVQTVAGQRGRMQYGVCNRLYAYAVCCVQRWLHKQRDDRLVERLLIAHKRKRVVHSSTKRRSMHNIAGKIMLVTALLTALDA